MARFAALKAEIDYELHNLKQLSKELDDILSATEEGSIARTRAVGSLLHDFYSGAEKIFRQIAVKIDQDLPTGEGWHIQLLKRMAMSIEGIRPQVIDEKLENDRSLHLSASWPKAGQPKVEFQRDFLKPFLRHSKDPRYPAFRWALEF